MVFFPQTEELIKFQKEELSNVLKMLKYQKKLRQCISSENDNLKQELLEIQLKYEKQNVEELKKSIGDGK